MNIFTRLAAKAALGRGELRIAYQERKREIEARAEYQRSQAKTKLEERKVKSEKAKEMADLESAMYQAEINQQLAEERARQLRHKAGHYTAGERVEQFGRDAYKVGKSFVQGLREEPKRTRRVAKKATSTTRKPKKRVAKKTTKRKTKRR